MLASMAWMLTSISLPGKCLQHDAARSSSVHSFPLPPCAPCCCLTDSDFNDDNEEEPDDSDDEDYGSKKPKKGGTKPRSQPKRKPPTKVSLGGNIMKSAYGAAHGAM